MSITDGWLPLSQEKWELVVFLFQLFPLVSLVQWAQIFNALPQWYPMGKTSQPSRFNLPGRLAWATMETPGYLVVLYLVYTLPITQGIEHLPWPNLAMAWMFTFHYVYRSVIFAYLSPGIAPMHPFLWIGAIFFNILNGISIGGWLGGYGTASMASWQGQWNSVRVELGMMLWAVALLSNIFHDDDLREIRRAAARDQKKRQEAEKEGQKAGGGAQRVYRVPHNGLFKIILYPHYLSEWLEWCGYWMMGGASFVPGRIFVVNEIATMLPRAVQGRDWYLQRFGREKIGSRKAVIPGLL